MFTQLGACSWWPARVSKRRIDESKCRVRYLGVEAYDDVAEPYLARVHLALLSHVTRCGQVPYTAVKSFAEGMAAGQCTLLHTAAHYCTLLYTSGHCYTLLHTTIHYCALLYSGLCLMSAQGFT